MKMILFLAAVYSLIINQCQQKKSSARMPASFVVPVDKDSISEDARIIKYNNIPSTENKPIVTAAINYSLASSEFLESY
jgi:hypothetical protein